MRLSTFIYASLVTLLLVVPGSAKAERPLLQLENIVYEGAFRLPANKFGGSSLNYSQGPLEYNRDNHSIFIVGHAHHQNIAEFSVPRLVKSNSISALPMASSPLQEFSGLLERTNDGNPENLDRIGGMEYIGTNGGQLIVNCYEYYDAPGDNTLTTLIARDSSNLASAEIDGFHSYQGEAGHTSGWISPVPASLQSQFGGTHITGHSSGIPIISRTSVGPSAFSFNHSDLSGTDTVGDQVATTRLLDFSLAHPLHDDLSNDSRTNSLWTHLSRVVYGLIVPGTRTYLTIGHSGGHTSGVCYKCTQSDGNLCGGYCARDAEDYYHYYWLWDINDLLEVDKGSKPSYAVKPYDYGVFPTPFATDEFGGGTYDEVAGLLYLTVQKADREQGTYSNPPVVVAFSFDIERSTQNVAPINFLLLK